jgi:ribulose-phosphate 3-epimerase
MQSFKIAASVLSADLAYLADDCRAMLLAGADALHLDIMDHHYVPNLTFGAKVCAALTGAGLKTFYDVHLMVEKPEQYIDAFATAGAHCCTFHPSTTQDPKGLLHAIHDKGMKAGLAFNPDEAIAIDDETLKLCDMILVMSVFPGFGGQPFIPQVLTKLPSLILRCKQLEIHPIIAMDGGLHLETLALAKDAGVNYFVMGSGLFSADDYKERVLDYRTILTEKG